MAEKKQLKEKFKITLTQTEISAFQLASMLLAAGYKVSVPSHSIREINDCSYILVDNKKAVVTYSVSQYKDFKAENVSAKTVSELLETKEEFKAGDKVLVPCNLPQGPTLIVRLYVTKQILAVVDNGDKQLRLSYLVEGHYYAKAIKLEGNEDLAGKVLSEEEVAEF